MMLAWAVAVLSTAYAGLLIMPGLTELTRDRRSGPPEVALRRWLDLQPDPVMVAFVAGGPHRVTDVIIAELYERERLDVTGDGLRLSGPVVGAYPGTLDGAWLTAVLEGALGAGDPVSVPAVRRLATASPAMSLLWDTVASCGLVHDRGATRPTAPRIVGTVVVCGLGLGLTTVIASVRHHLFGAATSLVGAFVGGALVVVGLAVIEAREGRARRRLLDPRTDAGRRAVALAASRDRYAVAVHGLAARPDLPDPLRLAPPSGWPAAGSAS